MLNIGSPLTALLAAPVRDGAVTWIGMRPARLQAMVAVEAGRLLAGTGILGDHSRGGGRQVTLIEAEDLAAIASYLGQERIGPETLRRNIVVAGLNLLALKGRRFRVGGAVLECSGLCHPCSRMEQALGLGGYNAVRGHGGITARVLTDGDVRIGDTVAALAVGRL